MVLERNKSCLMVVDVQERLAPVMSDPRRVLHNCGLLMRAAQRLEIPTLVTEQYPKGLGPTMVDLRPYIPEEGAMPKLHFSAAADEAILAKLQGLGRSQVVIAGIETHVCVLQTALDLMGSGRVDPSGWVQSFPLDDGVTAFQRMLAAKGADIKGVIEP